MNVSSKKNRKLYRSLHLLRKHAPEVSVSLEKPSTILYVGNSGVVCGVAIEELTEVFKEFGHVKDIFIFPQKPYSFVEFSEIAEAQSTLETLQSSHPPKISNKEVIFYLAYADRLPNSSTHGTFGIPEDCTLVEDFVTEQEEATLWQIVKDRVVGSSEDFALKNRSVIHFGYNFVYESGANRALTEGPFPEGIPAICNEILDRIMAAGHADTRPDQITVNVYQPGQGIPFHVDTHSAFEDSILSLSLLSPIQMEFLDNESDSRLSQVLTPRSLLVMKGAGRYRWKHGISPRKYDALENGRLLKRSLRCSFTFRAVRRIPCKCEFPMSCDWSRHEEGTNEPLTFSDLEHRHVTSVYDAIAPHFNGTRHSEWPGVKRFLNSVEDGSTVLDVGCGNGKYLGWDGRLAKMGCDLSVQLCAICRSKGRECVAGNCLSIPFRSNSFDASISIAVIHHLSSVERRLKAIREQIRVLRRGGRALIYVWALEQKRNSQKSSYLKCSNSSENQDVPIRSQLRKSVKTESGILDLTVHKNREEFQSQDLLVPWEMNKTCLESEIRNENRENTVKEPTNTKFLRFYHVFKEGELEELCGQVEGCRVADNFYEQGNWCVVVEKT